MNFPVLYSRTSVGNIQTWQIFVEGNAYYTIEGIRGGKLTQSEPTFVEGKNISRANETTAEEQTIKEAAAKHKKKLEGGYHVNVNDIDKRTYFKPQLAKKWEDYPLNPLEQTLFSQGKLDGIRCVTNSDGMFSRNGKPLISAPHIFAALKDVFTKYPTLVIDGELYNHKFKADFNKIISLARQTKPTAENLLESEKLLQYHIYDCYFEDAANKPFGERFTEISKIIRALKKDFLVIVKTDLVKTTGDLDKLYAEYLDEGYEGQMIRQDEKYECKRSKFLLKRKTFIDKEFPLVDLEEGKGGRAGMATIAILKLEDGRTFEAGIIGDFDYCRELLKNKKKYIGVDCTVVYQNTTPDGIPRFAKLKIIRNYE